MKSTQIWSRDLDRKILIVAGKVCSLAIAALTGAAIPPPTPADEMRLFDGFVTTMLLIFVWGVFHLLRPSRDSRGWSLAQFIAIPLAWALLVGVLAFWFGGLNSAWHMDYERLNVGIL